MEDKFRKFEEMHNSPAGNTSGGGGGTRKTTGQTSKKQKKMAEFEAMHEAYVQVPSAVNQEEEGKQQVKTVSTAASVPAVQETQSDDAEMDNVATTKRLARERQNSSRAKSYQAKQEYERYLGSEEYEVDKVSEGVSAAYNEAEYYAAAQGFGGATRKEKELKAKADYWEQQAQAEEDAATLRRDMAQIVAMPEEDRGMLERYIAESQQEKYSFLGDRSFGKAQLNAAELFDKYGARRVAELAESYGRWMNQENAKKTAQMASEGAGKSVGGAIGHSAASVGASLVGAVTAPLGYLGELSGRTGRYSTTDPNNVGNLPNVYSGAVRQQVAGDIEGDEGSGVRKALSYGYQGVMSAADSIARIAVTGGSGAASLGLAAMGSFGQTMSEASKQGASPAQAVIQATADAGLEVLTEKLPLDELLKTAKGGAKTAGQVIGTALKQAGIEATTEEISLLGSLAAEAAVLRGKSSYSRIIGDLISGGMTYEEAKEEAARAIWEDVKETAYISAISGGVSSSGTAVAANIGEKVSRTDYFAGLLRGLTPAKKVEPPKTEAQQRLDAAIQGKRSVDTGNTVEEVPAAEMKEMFPSEISVQEEIENLYREKEAIEKQLYAASEVGNFGEDFRRVSEQWNEISARIRELEGTDDDRVESLEREEAPPEREMPASFSRWESVAVNPLEGRTEQSVGSQKVKAYQYENPEVKPFFQEAARGLLYDIDNSIRGERTYNDALFYESGGEKGWSGTKRNTTRDIAEIKDSYGYTWDELREAAEDIIHDRGRENNAASKRLEFLIHDRLANGYTDVEGRPIPENREYLNFLEERQVNEYRRESMDALMENAEQYAPKGKSNGFEAMGAASGWFSPYTRMQHEYGNFPDGEDAVRPDDTPISTDGTDRVSYTARTVKGAAATPEDFIGDLENLVVRGGMSYIPITNNAAAKNAAESIRRLGWDDSLAEWRSKVRSGRTGADMVATGAILLNNAANAGDKRQWLRILDDYRKLGTNTAQGLQAFRILKKLAPEDRLYMIRRSVNQMVEDMHLDSEITIDDDLAKAYQEAETDEAADRILAEIQKDVAAQIPSTAMDKWTALRYVNMLGNFRTQVRNVAGNIGAQAAYRVKDSMAAVIEAAADKATAGKFGRTKSVVVNRELRKAAARDFDAMKGAVLDGGKYADSTSERSDFVRGVMEQRRIFRNPIMEGYRKGTNWAMNNDFFGDAAFGRAAYARALAGYLQANGVKGNSLEGVDSKLMDKARAYAIQEAQEATFRDNNAVSDWISKIGRRKDTPKAAKAIAEGIMPFRKTPANVLVRAEEFSPLGLINATVNSIRAARGGEITGAEVVNSWAKALTGTGLTILGAALGNAGLLAGGPDADEDEAKFDELNGYQNYALQLPDGTNLTIDFLSPVAMPLFLGAQLQKIMDEGGYQLSDLEAVFTSIADPMIQMSMLQGVNDTLDNIKYSENNMGQFLLNAATSYLSQGITNTLMGQLERAGEDSRMTTYVDKDSALSPWVQRQLGKLSQKIPGIDYQQIPYLDAWGEEEHNPEGAWDYLYNLLSPSYVSRGKTDALAEELYRLNEVQSDVNVFPDSPESTLTFKDKDGNVHEDYNLSSEQWQTMARTEGQTQNRIARALTESADYAALTDEQKAKAISLAYDYAREAGRVAAIADYPGLAESWMEGIDGREAGAIINKVASAAITDAFSALTESWRDGHDGAEAAQDLEGAYEVYKGLSLDARKKVLDSASGRMEYYLTARSKGVSAETFTQLYKTYWDIDQSGSDTSAKAEKWSYALQRAQETGRITESQKDALKDSMVYMQMFPAETEKFDQMTEVGISAKKALDVGKLLKGLTPKVGKSSVTVAQKAEAIAGAKLTDREKTAVMKLYLSDAQDQNLDDMAAMGYSAADYAAAYSIYIEEDNKGGKGTKARTISRLMEAFAVDRVTATAIYEIYG